MKQCPIIILIGILLVSNMYAKSSQIYSFDTSQQSIRFNKLLTELRCLVCQNEALADSNAKLAQDLRLLVYRSILVNKSDQEIKDYLVKRYGDFILFKPPVQHNTFVLWLGPLFLLFVGICILLYFIWRHRPKI